ncbi:uncharacterized protein LOC134275552 [Saccostrea cucullata]|uniref:uncharacterized protein LOC134275552 n=1 Tax=Saccostrea cuccullata TaxID=36930 RepID=UPI002ED1EFF7
MGRTGHISRSFITCVFSFSLLISSLNLVSSQNMQIQALPQIVDMGEDTLTIVCSLSNPSQVKSLYFIELQRNTSVSFERLIDRTLNTDNFQEETIYTDLTLQGRTTATGSLKPPSTAELRLTFTKNNVKCPEDFKEYRCKMSGLDSNSNSIPEQDAVSNPVKISYRVQPKLIERPSVRILGQQFDTNERQFEVGAALQLTCTGQIGSDPSATIRWCAKTAGAQSFTGLPQTPLPVLTIWLSVHLF